MALVNIQTGRGRQKFYEFVVVGSDAKGCKRGDIRWVQWDRSKSSPMLKIDWVDKERSAVKEIRLDADYKRKGWSLLRDMYEEDPERRPYFEDFKAFAQAQQDNPEGMKHEKFPEERLPRKLQEMRASQRDAALKAKAFRFPSDGKALESDDDVALDEPANEQPALSEPEPESKPEASGDTPKTTRGRKRS